MTKISKVVFQQHKIASCLIVLALMSVGTACNESYPKIVSSKPTELGIAPSREAAEVVIQEQLSGSIETFVNKTILVRGEVRQTIEDVSFLLEDEQLLGGKDILVINGGKYVTLLDGDESDLHIIGIVQQLVLSDFEKTMVSVLPAIPKSTMASV